MHVEHGWTAGAAAAGIALAALALTSAGCGRQPASGAPAPPPPQVAVVEVRPSRVSLTTELPGRTVPYLVAEIRPQVNGLLRERAFEEGADVRAGALLYRIDPAPYQAAYNQAQAALAVAEASLPALRSRVARLKDLVAIDAAGQQDLDDAAAALQQAEANVASAKAAIETARVNLSYTPVRAPISGRTGRSAITPGALVTAYQPVPLTTIQQLDPIYVDVTQSTAELLTLRRRLGRGALERPPSQANRVQLLLEDGTPYEHRGTLRFRDVSVDPTTGSVTLRMVFPNPDHVLLPGMYVRAVVEDAVDDRALLVPQQGVSRDSKGQAFVYLVSATNQIEQRAITTERAIGSDWLVTSGLAPGDRVVVEGLQRIRPGAPVQVAAAAGAPSAAPAAGAASAAAQGERK